MRFFEFHNLSEIVNPKTGKEVVDPSKQLAPGTWEPEHSNKPGTSGLGLRKGLDRDTVNQLRQLRNPEGVRDRMRPRMGAPVGVNRATSSTKQKDMLGNKQKDAFFTANAELKDLREEFWKQAIKVFGNREGFSLSNRGDGGWGAYFITPDGVRVLVGGPGTGGKNWKNAPWNIIVSGVRSKETLDYLTDSLSNFKSSRTVPKWARQENGSHIGSVSLYFDEPLTAESIEKMLDVTKKVESTINSDEKLSGSMNSRGAGKKISRNMSNFNYYVGVASIIYIATRFGLSDIVPRGGKIDPKKSGMFDINDETITVGMSEKYAEAKKNGTLEQIGTWREHVVPCDLIVQEAIRMCGESKPLDLSKDVTNPNQLIDMKTIVDVARMIQDNLMIVDITKPEQQLLDQKLKLQSTMPSGWKFGDDPFARLDAGQINVVQYGEVPDSEKQGSESVTPGSDGP